MKLNIFKIPKENTKHLREKLKALGLESIHGSIQGGWSTTFYFSEDVDPTPIPWVETYADFFTKGYPENKIFFSCYLWEKDDHCFALSYGKCHFYLKQFCDHDFGTFIAKRIANENDVRQKSSKKFAGRKKKEIRSYTKNTHLDIESGESVDYLNAGIVSDKRKDFGKTGKFGSSALFNPEGEKDKLPAFFDSLVEVHSLEEQFPLPRTTNINNTAIARECEEKLLDEILSASDGSDFTASSHDLVGVDFVFSGSEKYQFSHRGKKSNNFDELSIENLNQFVKANSIPRAEILGIKIIVKREEGKEYPKYVKDALDYIVDDKNIILSQGQWMEFNEDYITQLDEYVDSIDIEETEAHLIELDKNEEGDLNKMLESHGYKNADKDFTKIKVSSGISIEAWDLKKDETVYATKIGTPQKLGYVCDQANNTMDLIKKKANIKTLDETFKNYCLWIVLTRKTKIIKLSEINSIIFKQKIESWARKCNEYGIRPKVKISYMKEKEVVV